MSLTSHLKSTSSPVRQFISTRFPHTSPLLVADPADPTSLLPVSAGEAIVRPDESSGYPWAAVGMALDYRFRLFMECASPESLAAHRGALLLETRGHHVPGAFGELCASLLALVPVGSRTDGILADTQERELLRVCYVLALYEQCYRSLPNESWPIMRLGPRARLADLIALCPDAALDDLVELSKLASVQARPIFDATEHHLNPTFAGSRLLRGADADVVADRCLFELKCSVKKKPQRQELWQLLGYVLADLDDLYKIEAVGFYYARQGIVLRWPLGAFLEVLAGGPVALDKTRAEFADVLETVEAARAERVAALRDRLSRRLGAIRALHLYPLIGAKQSKRHASRAEGTPYQAASATASVSTACGAPGRLDFSAQPLVLAVGQRDADVDAVACRRCLRFAHRAS